MVDGASGKSNGCAHHFFEKLCYTNNEAAAASVSVLAYVS